ncbi:hypothetical protein Q3G72_028691 [Acer saccharum]|nr:hypothetical protein Q3G72_028691 [Acer saccharum]
MCKVDPITEAQAREGLEKPVQVDVETNCDVQEANKSEKTPYGPWLLVSYGKQGNRFFKGRYGKVGNGTGTTKYGDGKAFQNGNNYVRNMEGDSTKGISGNKSQVNNKNKNCSEGIINSGGGSRFDILSKDMDVVVDEGLPTGAIKMKGKSALVDITNLDSPNGKSGQWLKKSSRKTCTGDKLKTKLVTHQGAAGCSKGIKVAQGSLQVQKAADQDVAMEGAR